MTDRGRPQDAFGDPVIRLRSWVFDQRLCAETGLREPADLARRFGIGRAAHFAYLRLDGADPQRLEVGESSLLDVLAAHPQGAAACQDYRHRLWDSLLLVKQAQQVHRRYTERALLDQQIRDHGLVRITYEDFVHGRFLGLFPHFDPFRHFDPAKLQLNPCRLATLDGLDALLGLFRNAIQESAYRYAGVFAELLEETVRCFVIQHWPDSTELRDTWHWVFHSRMLGSRAMLRPTHAELAQAWTRWTRLQVDDGVQQVEEMAKNVRRSERRVRRKIYMNACANMYAPQRNPSFYARASESLQWLADNREGIRDHHDVAWRKIMNSSRPLMTVTPPTLVMSAELFASRVRPRPEQRPGYRKIDQFFDAMPVTVRKA